MVDSFDVSQFEAQLDNESDAGSDNNLSFDNFEAKSETSEQPNFDNKNSFQFDNDSESGDRNDDESVSSYAGSDLNEKEIEQKKVKLLSLLKRYQKKGFTVSRHYTMDSELEDLQAEVETIKREANLGAGVATIKSTISISTYLMEVLNNKFDPVGARLDGWSSQVAENIEAGDFDSVAEELYDKYSDKLDLPPEAKLASMLVSSAVQYHIAQGIVGNIVTKDATKELLKSNPVIKSEILKAVNNSNLGNEIKTNIAKTTGQSVHLENQNSMKESSDISDIMAELGIEDENTNAMNGIMNDDAMSIEF